MSLSQNLQNLSQRWHPTRLASIKAGVVQYVLTDCPDDDCAAFYLSFDDTGHTVTEGTAEEPTATVTMTHADGLLYLNGTLDIMQGIQKKTLKATGNIMLLRELFIAHKAAVAKGTLGKGG